MIVPRPLTRLLTLIKEKFKSNKSETINHRHQVRNVDELLMKKKPATAAQWGVMSVSYGVDI